MSVTLAPWIQPVFQLTLDPVLLPNPTSECLEEWDFGRKKKVRRNKIGDAI